MRKINSSKSKKNSKKGTMLKRKLVRSLKYGVGKNKGVIESGSFATTKSGRDAVELVMFDSDSGKKSKFLILLDCAMGETLIDNLMDIFELEEVFPEDLEGLEVGFETQMQGSFLYIKSFFAINEYLEEDDEEEEEEEELELDEDEIEEEEDDDDLELEEDEI